MISQHGNNMCLPAQHAAEKDRKKPLREQLKRGNEAGTVAAVAQAGTARSGGAVVARIACGELDEDFSASAWQACTEHRPLIDTVQRWHLGQYAQRV